MAGELIASVWDEEQVLCDSPPEDETVRIWAEIARDLIGETAVATVSIDVDDGETELQLRAAGFILGEVDPEDETVEVEESLTLEREAPLGTMLDQVLRLPPEAPLGALVLGGGKGVDYDLGSGIDVWGPGALESVRRAAARLGLSLTERAAEE